MVTSHFLTTSVEDLDQAICCKYSGQHVKQDSEDKCSDRNSGSYHNVDNTNGGQSKCDVDQSKDCHCALQRHTSAQASFGQRKYPTEFRLFWCGIGLNRSLLDQNLLFFSFLSLLEGFRYHSISSYCQFAFFFKTQGCFSFVLSQFLKAVAFLSAQSW